MKKGVTLSSVAESAGNGGERIIGVPPNQTHSANHDHYDDGERDRIIQQYLVLDRP